MEASAGESVGRIVGRDAELSALRAFVSGPPAALVVTGRPGAGKTTLWEAGVAFARERGVRVLTARGGEFEARLAHAGLADLLDGIDLDALDGIPAPQRRALAVALLRAQPGRTPPEAHAIAAGLLRALRALAAGGRLLVAIDDAHWIDPPSAAALVYAARRLRGAPVGFLLTRRGRRTTLELALDADRLEAGPLSLGATRRLVFDRLGISLPRRVVRRIFETAQGSPLLALELARLLVAHGGGGEGGAGDEARRAQARLAIGEDLPVPELAEDLLGARIAELDPSARRAVLALALEPGLHVGQLAALAGRQGVEAALDAELLVLDADRARVSHPLVAAAVRERCGAGERRSLHRALAGVVGDEVARARHLALATDVPSVAVATEVAAAAARAAARGAAEQAVELAEQALRTTPPGSASRPERLLTLAEYLLVAGETARVTELLAPAVNTLPSGPARARAHLLLYDGAGVVTVDDGLRHLELALAEAGGDPALGATAVARKVECILLTRVERVVAAEGWARAALSAARRAGPDVERLVLHALGWARILRGRPVAALARRFDAASADAFHVADSLDRVAALRLAWRGEAGAAREALSRLLALADERGEALSWALLRLHLCELELRAGGLEAAARLLDEWEDSTERALLAAPNYERCRALLAALRGCREEAEGWASVAIAAAEAVGVRWDALEASRARGIAALAAGEPAAAAAALGGVWDHLERAGVEDPGPFPVAGDLVEALVLAGRLGDAEAVAERLALLAARQRHPWGRATAVRCRALVRLAHGYDEAAAGALESAAAAYGDLGLALDRARSLLALGRIQRRHRKWGAARRTLAEAATAFEAAGADGWAASARAELGRVGGRRAAAAGTLTPGERRAAELAAEGLPNKEIARRLFVTVSTVEVQLSRAYAKLGIRSRAQLAARLAETSGISSIDRSPAGDVASPPWPSSSSSSTSPELTTQNARPNASAPPPTT